MSPLSELSTWGLLPLAVPLLIFTASRAAWLVFPRGTRRERLAAAVVLGIAFVHASVGVLGEAGLVSRESLALALALVATTLLVAVKPGVTAPMPWRELLGPGLFAGGVLAFAALTARILPVWQWDSLGYHLPFVNFVLQHGGFAEVPPDLHYISTYPHNVELGMIWLRALLPDDRLIDLAQVPFGAAGALLTAVIARELGAPRGLAAAAGAAWLSLPIVFLQLPTNYVDVGAAAALLGALYFLLLTPFSARGLVLGALALGLFLGAKPSAPLATALVAGVAVLRAWRAGRLEPLLGAGVVLLVFGAQMYVEMAVRHGNPVWPVAVHLGPFTLPGTHRVEELLAAGSALPRATGTVLERTLVSWLAVDAAPSFDMKVGGNGLVFLLALPLAALGLVRRRSLLIGAALAAALLSPDPSMARYVLAFPALVLALAAAELTTVRWRGPACAAATLAVAWQLAHTFPGLVGEGPPWRQMLLLDDEARRVALGPHGRPTDYPPAWARVREGEAAAFDPEFEFPGLLWSPELRYPVLATPPRVLGRDFVSWLEERRVRLVAVGEGHRALLEQSPAWERLFECRSGPCAVYVRR